MQKLKKLFGAIAMPWRRVFCIAVLSAVYTAIMLLIPALEETSFQGIGINLEWWIPLALLIVTNCSSRGEAAAKCFVFFLVSQPLIYLLQVPFSEQGWGLFSYYPRWGFMTLLTLPGAAAAWQVTRKDGLGAAALGIAAVFFIWRGVSELRWALNAFPRHLLSTVFCFVCAAALIELFTEGKKKKLLFAVTAAVLALCLGLMLPGKVRPAQTVALPEGEWAVSVEEPSLFTVSVEGESAEIRPRKQGSSLIRFKSAEGECIEYWVTFYGYSLWVSETGE